MMMRKLNVADAMWLPGVGLLVLMWLFFRHFDWLDRRYSDPHVMAVVVWQLACELHLAGWLHQ